MEWIIKANLNLLLFGLIYHMLLHLKGRYTFARIYLLLTPLLSLVIPLMLLINVETNQNFSYVLQPVSISAANTLVASSSYSVLDMLSGIYYAGVVVSLSIFLINLARLFYAPLKNTAWSFFGWVHIPAASGEHTGMMQLHEEAHVKQWHSADIVYYQFIKAFFWFNPIVYALFRRLKEVHEFSADEYALKQTSDKIFYCELLLNETFGVETHSLINPFHSRSTIFNRITMITQTEPQRVSRWKYLAMLPLLAAVFFLSLTPKNVLAQEKKDKVYQGQDLPEVMPEFKGGQEALIKFLSDNINYPADARKEKVEGKVVLKFVIDKTGRITKIENVKESVDVRLVKEAIRVVSAMPAWTPGKDKGQPVDVSFTLPISFKL